MSTIGALMPVARLQAINSTGVMNGAKLFTYIVGSSTKKNTYSDSGLTTPNTNPVVADSLGFFGPIYAAQQSVFKLVLSPSTDTDPPTNPVWTQDNVELPSILDAGTAGVLQSDGAGNVIFTSSPTLTTPIVSAAINLTGGQIDFPATQNPSVGANVLDDYEEGTWTPVIGGAGGTSGQTYTTQVGFYVKIGQMVFAGFSVTASVIGTVTGHVQIQGLPFTAQTTTADMWDSHLSFTAANSDNTTVHVRVASATTVANVLANISTTGGAGNTANWSSSDTENGVNLAGTIVYRASA